MAVRILWQEDAPGRVKTEILQNILWLTCLTEEPPPPTGPAYYVAPGGNDSNPGTLERPWRTIQHAANSVSGGDTVYVQAGTYHEKLTVAKSGSAGRPITISNYPGHSPVIDGQYTLPAGAYVVTDPVSGEGFNYGGLVDISGAYITLRGFTVRHSRGRGILINSARVSGCHHITVEGCLSEENRNAGLRSWAAYTTVDGCTFYHNANYCQYQRATPSWPPACAILNSTRPVIRNSICYENWGEGLVLIACDNGLVEHCITGRNMRVALYLPQTRDSTVQRNLVYDLAPPFATNIQPGIGLSVDGPGGSVGWAGRNKVINNVVVGCRHGFKGGPWRFPNRGGLVDCLIANNVFYETQGSSQSTIYIDYSPDAQYSGTVIKNNIVVQTDGVIADVRPTSGLTFDYNCWSKTPPANVRGAHDIIGNPRLVNPDPVGTCAQDATRYKIASTSPCRNAGTSIALVTDDYWKTARPQGSAYDIGMHELEGG